MSEKLNRVFYYNVKTRIGQWEVPDVFLGSDEMPASWEEEQEEADGPKAEALAPPPPPPAEQVRSEDAFTAAACDVSQTGCSAEVRS